MADDSQLQLRYTFLPTPNPILTSEDDQNPQTVDLQVMISNPGTSPVTMNSVAITIPVGANAAGSLSAALSLPQPQTQGDFPFDITVVGGTLTLRPPPNGSGEIASTLLMTLSDITVNQINGTVQIEIDEFPSGGGKATDAHTYTLTKLKYDVPVTSFTAEPAVVNSPDETVTLHWACTEVGKGDVYALRSDQGWQPRDCVESGTCYQAQDGVTGVVTQAVTQTTEFYLDVIEVGEGDQRQVVDTLTVTVPLVEPSVAQISYVAQAKFGSGQLVRAHWLAYNALSCSLEVDGVTVAEGLPSDTYQAGYPLVLEPSSAAQQISVVANAIVGTGQATWPLGEVVVSGTPTTVSLSVGAFAVAVTPDGSLAIAVEKLYDGASATAVSLTSAAVQGDPVALGRFPTAVAVTPDGTLALVANQLDATVTVIDLPSFTAESNPITVGFQSELNDIAITPDGSLALTIDGTNARLWAIDIAGRTVKAHLALPAEPQALGITPDGLALVAYEGEVEVVDIARWKRSGDLIQIGSRPVAIAVSPTGDYALLSCPSDPNDGYDDAFVAVIDLATRTTQTISVPNDPAALAFTPDGRYAFVGALEGNTIWVIDMTTLKLLTTQISASGSTLWKIAVTPDGLMVVAANTSPNSVVLA